MPCLIGRIRHADHLLGSDSKVCHFLLSRTVWCAFFAKGQHTLFAVCRGGDGGTSKRLCHRATLFALRGMDHGPADFDRMGRQGDGTHQHDFGRGAGGLVDRRGKAAGKRAVCLDTVSEQRRFLYQRFGQQPQQPLRAPPARHDTDTGLWQRQRCAGCHHANIAGRSQIQTATEGMPVQNRKRWL